MYANSWSLWLSIDAVPAVALCEDVTAFCCMLPTRNSQRWSVVRSWLTALNIEQRLMLLPPPLPPRGLDCCLFHAPATPAGRILRSQAASCVCARSASQVKLRVLVVKTTADVFRSDRRSWHLAVLHLSAYIVEINRWVLFAAIYGGRLEEQFNNRQQTKRKKSIKKQYRIPFLSSVLSWLIVTEWYQTMLEILTWILLIIQF